jgi:Restriction endonuclease S subunits
MFLTFFSSNKSHYQQFEPQFEIPSLWEWTTLEELIILMSGQDFPPDKYNSTLNGVPYIIGASNIQNGKVVVTRWTESPTVLSEMNDLLIVCKGAGVGKMGINQIGTAHIARQIQALRPFSNYVNLEYIRVVLMRGIETICSQANGLIPGLPRDLLLKFPIPLPPLTEQIKIANSVAIAMNIIDRMELEAKAVQNDISLVKSKILDLAMQGKLVSQDASDEPAADMLLRINPKAKITTDNPQCQNLPSGWTLCELRDLCIFLSRGKSPKYSEMQNQYPVFAQKCNLKDGGISLALARFLDESTLDKWPSKYHLLDGDILINSTGTGTVGRTRIFDNSCMGHYTFVVPDSHVSVARIFEDINSKYIFYCLYSKECQRYFEENLAGSTNQKELYIDIIGDRKIMLPPLNEQCRIVRKIEELYKVLNSIETSLQS